MQSLSDHKGRLCDAEEIQFWAAAPMSTDTSILSGLEKGGSLNRGISNEVKKF